MSRLPDAGAARLQVLVVDDEPMVLKALERTLRREFDVIAVSDAPTAVEALENCPDVAVVLTDQRMPGLGGVDLLTELRQMRPQTVGVLLTGYADIQSVKAAINEAGAFAYLTKPWDDEELLLTVRRAVEAYRTRLVQHGVDRERQRREIQSLEEYSATAPAPITARQFGQGSLRDVQPEAFAALSNGYERLLHGAFERRLYKLETPISEQLRDLAERMGMMRAGPRDVVDVHTTATRRVLERIPAEQSGAYLEEGRLLLVELMGHLASHYRALAMGRTG